MIFQNNQEQRSLPRHIAIILDGNGRWAASHALPRALGHKKGCETLEQTVEDCARLGIEYLTVYGFSTENWKRSEEEVGALMQLFRFYMKKLITVANANNVRAKMIGERSRFPEDIQKGIAELEESTKANTGMLFSFAVNYGGRDEMIRAIRRIAFSPYGRRVLELSGYCRNTGSGFGDSHLRRVSYLQLPPVAVRLCGVLYQLGILAGF